MYSIIDIRIPCIISIVSILPILLLLRMHNVVHILLVHRHFCTIGISFVVSSLCSEIQLMVYVHLELGRQWKVILFHMYFVKRRIRIFKT
jgi:hypothetical protein